MLFSESENEKHNIVMRNLQRRLYHKSLQNSARCYLQRRLSAQLLQRRR